MNYNKIFLIRFFKIFESAGIFFSRNRLPIAALATLIVLFSINVAVTFITKIAI